VEVRVEVVATMPERQELRFEMLRIFVSDGHDFGGRQRVLR
jgi:hypothetical protein